jgi:hypothetical protein
MAEKKPTKGGDGVIFFFFFLWVFILCCYCFHSLLFVFGLRKFIVYSQMAAVVFDSRCVVVLCLVSILLMSGRVNSEPTQDKQALLAFLNQTPHANCVQWNSSELTCDWVGIACDANRSYVYFLRLLGVGLVGPIPPNTLGRLSRLRVLSLRANRLTSQIPSDFSNLTFLRSFYVQDNALSGEFPPGLTQLTRLTRLDLNALQPMLHISPPFVGFFSAVVGLCPVLGGLCRHDLR